jgi:phenylpropionate dioxygenase-like ring-hydroxylating dioxygenase large terminal subunit
MAHLARTDGNHSPDPAWDSAWDLQPDFIPAERYTSRAFAGIEDARLWPRTWQVACREEELTGPGDFVEYRIVDQSILVVRSEGDEIRAFYNSCRHRGTRLAKGCGTLAGGQITCPFHGWRWNLDGACAFVLDPEEFGLTSLDTPGLQLGELRCERRWGFVWICADPDARPLEEHLTPLQRYFDPFRLEDMRFLWYRTTVLPTNWKAALDAFHEGYHNYGTHPQLLHWSDDTAMRYEQFPNGHARYVTVRGAGPSKRFDLSPDQWDDRELLYQQVMHLGRSFEGGLYSEADMDAAARLRTMDIPEDSSAAAEFSRLVAEHAAQTGIPFPELTPEQRAEGTGVFSVFPNLVMLVSLANCFMYRARPDGDDPDSCIFDMWALRLFPPTTDPPALERATAEFDDEDAWGVIPGQDFANMPEVQAGLHSWGCRGLRLSSRQEMNLLNMQRELDRYVRQ